MSSEAYLNSNMDQRPSNASLFITAVSECIVSGFAGGILLATILLFSRGLPFDMLSWALIALGAAIVFIAYLFTHFSHAKKQRLAFVTAGGDPTGITLLMFGAMGGKVLPNGLWQWHDPNAGYSSDGGY